MALVIFCVAFTEAMRLRRAFKLGIYATTIGRHSRTRETRDPRIQGSWCLPPWALGSRFARPRVTTHGFASSNTRAVVRSCEVLGVSVEDAGQVLAHVVGDLAPVADLLE